MGRLTMMHAVGLAIGALVSVSPALAADDDIELPQPLVWTAYDIGSTGSSQAVGIGAALKNNLRVNLRVLPGKNAIPEERRAGKEVVRQCAYRWSAYHLIKTIIHN